MTAFWAAYVVTRPLGASTTDWLASSRADGLGLGTGWVSLGTTVAIVALIAVLAVRTRGATDDAAAPSAAPDRSAVGS